jgi:hypothetical protein
MKWFIPDTPLAVQSVSTEGGGFCLVSYPFPSQDSKKGLDGISIRRPGKKRRAGRGGPNGNQEASPEKASLP